MKKYRRGDQTLWRMLGEGVLGARGKFARG